MSSNLPKTSLRQDHFTHTSMREVGSGTPWQGAGLPLENEGPGVPLPIPQTVSKHGIASKRRSKGESNDAALARALISGESWAPWVAWQRFAPLVRNVIERLLRSGAEVDDLVQDTFLIFFNRVMTLQRADAIRSFMISISVKVARRELRRRRVRRLVMQSDLQSPSAVHPAVHQDPDAREALAHFVDILGRLNDGDRAAFVQHVVQNAALVEVASAAHTSLSTIKRRLASTWSRIAFEVGNDQALCHYPGRRSQIATRHAPAASRVSPPPPIRSTHQKKLLEAGDRG